MHIQDAKPEELYKTRRVQVCRVTSLKRAGSLGGTLPKAFQASTRSWKTRKKREDKISSRSSQTPCSSHKWFGQSTAIIAKNGLSILAPIGGPLSRHIVTEQSSLLPNSI